MSEKINDIAPLDITKQFMNDVAAAAHGYYSKRIIGIQPKDSKIMKRVMVIVLPDGDMEDGKENIVSKEGSGTKP